MRKIFGVRYRGKKTRGINNSLREQFVWRKFTVRTNNWVKVSCSENLEGEKFAG